MQHDFNFKNVVSLSERASWMLDELMPESATFDFTKPFLPESIARTNQIEGLSPDERLKLNQVFAHAYATLFFTAEEYVIRDSFNQAAKQMERDRDGARAWSRFGDEEIKHQQMFARIQQAISKKAGFTLATFPGPADLAKHILTNTSLATLLLTLQLEMISLRHFTDSVKDNAELEPRFVSLLKHHWAEESQHVKVDVIQISQLAKELTPDQKKQGLEQYFGLVGALDTVVIATQLKLDMENFEKWSGRKLTDAQRAQITKANPMRYAFIEQGLENGTFLEWIGQLDPAAKQRAQGMAKPS